MSSAMFVDDAKKATIGRWYETFRGKNAPTAQSKVLVTSFGRTHCLVTGPERAAPLVVLHGALASSAHVLPELGTLVHTRRVYAVDVLGQSVMSEDKRLDLDGDDYGRWLIEVADALGLDKLDLLGVSWGGFVAVRAASAMPARIEHLVLMVPAGWVAGSAWSGFWRVGLPMLSYRMFPSERRLEKAVGGLFTTPDAEWTRYFGDALLAYKLDMRIPPLATAERVSAIRCPVLVFAADEDLQFPGSALLQRVKELLPHAETELIEGSKHCPPFTAEFRNGFGHRVEQFLG